MADVKREYMEMTDEEQDTARRAMLKALYNDGWRYIGMNPNGTVYAHTAEPARHNSHWEYFPGSGSRCLYMGDCGGEGNRMLDLLRVPMWGTGELLDIAKELRVPEGKKRKDKAAKDMRRELEFLQSNAEYMAWTIEGFAKRFEEMYRKETKHDRG